MEQTKLEQPTILEQAQQAILGQHAMGQSGQDQGRQGVRRRLEGEERQVIRRSLALRRQERQD